MQWFNKSCGCDTSFSDIKFLLWLLLWQISRYNLIHVNSLQNLVFEVLSFVRDQSLRFRSFYSCMMKQVWEYFSSINLHAHISPNWFIGVCWSSMANYNRLLKELILKDWINSCVQPHVSYSKIAISLGENAKLVMLLSIPRWPRASWVRWNDILNRSKKGGKSISKASIISSMKTGMIRDLHMFGLENTYNGFN